MAGANLPAKKYKKTSPTVVRLSFEGDGNTTRFIDIGRALSVINRKFYRQGVYYYVNSVELYNNEDAYIDLHTLPDTWVTKNAWNLGFSKFQKMNNLSDVPRPKYHDFKVRMTNSQSETNTMDPDMYAINGSNASMAPDEWKYSEITTLASDGGAADEFLLHMLGPHDGSEGNWQSIGLIQSYAASRPEPNSAGEPDLVHLAEQDPMMTLFETSSDGGLENIGKNLNDNNDQTPYDHNDYIGESASHMQHVARLATSQITGRVAKASGFCAPLGLICVDPQQTSTDYRIVINLAQGTYHGVYAERA